MIKVLLTGSRGFIGSNIYKSYVDLGYEVIELDRLLGLDLNQLTDHDLEQILKDVDIVNHHSAQVDVRHSILYPDQDAHQNITLTLKLLNASVRSGVKKFIFASSAGAILDSNGLDNPATPYGIAKLTIEKYLSFYQHQFNLDVIILRYANVYGPFQKSGIIALMMQNALKGQEQVINGDGTQTRDYIFVGDVVRANNLALSMKSGSYTISTGTSTSLIELTRQINAIHTIKTTFGPSIPGEVKESLVHPIGPPNWNPLTSLEEGLRLTFAYYQSIY